MLNIIVETGEGVEGANSYVSLQEAWDFAESRGYSLPCDVKLATQRLFRAMDYIESLAGRYGGRQLFSTAFPREDGYFGCVSFQNNIIPSQVKQAQILTMVAIEAGFDPQQNVGSEPFVTEKMLGPMKVKYAWNPQVVPALTAVSSLLRPLFGSGGLPVRFVKA